MCLGDRIFNKKILLLMNLYKFILNHVKSYQNIEFNLQKIYNIKYKDTNLKEMTLWI